MSRISAREVLDYWCETRAISHDLIMSNDRRRQVSRERHMVMYAIRYLCPHMSYPMIGQLLNGLDHTSVMHGVRQVEKRIKAGDEETLDAISDVRSVFSPRYRSTVNVRALEARVETLDQSIHTHTESLNSLLAKRQQAYSDLVSLRQGVAAMERVA